MIELHGIRVTAREVPPGAVLPLREPQASAPQAILEKRAGQGLGKVRVGERDRSVVRQLSRHELGQGRVTPWGSRGGMVWVRVCIKKCWDSKDRCDAIECHELFHDLCTMTKRQSHCQRWL